MSENQEQAVQVRRSRKSTVIEVANRVNEVQNLLVNGATRQQIRNHISSKYGLTERQAENYIGKANKAFAIEDEEERKTVRAKVGRRLEKLYALAVKEADRAEMLRVLDRIIRFYGLDEPVRTVNLNANFDATKLSDEQLDKLLKERREKLQTVAPDLAEQYSEYFDLASGDEDTDVGEDGEGDTDETEADMGEQSDSVF